MAKAKTKETTTPTERKPNIKETIEVLTTQAKEYLEKAEYFKTMALKAQGALEVLSQVGEHTNEKGD